MTPPPRGPASEDVQNEYVVPLPSPPPPPSARRVNQPYTAPGGYAAPVLPADDTPVDQFSATTPIDATIDVEEANPFKKESRWKRFVKKPSREFMVRASVAVAALGVGWGVGAKPWKSHAPARGAVMAAKAPAAKGAAPRTNAQPPRRVAMMAHAATPAPAPAARTALKPTTPVAGKSTATNVAGAKPVAAKTTTTNAKVSASSAKTTTTKSVAAKPAVKLAAVKVASTQSKQAAAKPAAVTKTSAKKP